MRPSAETSTGRPRPLYCTSNEPLNAGRKCNKRLGGCNVLLLNTDTTILSITWCCHDEEYFVSEPYEAFRSNFSRSTVSAVSAILRYYQ